MVRKFVRRWWNGLIYDPKDPRHLSGGKIRVVALGGGTGLSNLLRGLKKYTTNLAAIVTMTDDGASSGILRDEFDIPPPGDVRKCISALAYDERTISELFEFRFHDPEKSFAGHTLGNIWLTALSERFGSFEKALEFTSALFSLGGQILPSTLKPVRLIAEYRDGSQITGETEIARAGQPIKKVLLSRPRVAAYPKTLKKIAAANLIIFGPGSLFTSIIPNLLISGISRAIRANSRAAKVYIANCSTERGETETLGIREHLLAVEKALGAPLDFCLVNSRIIRRAKNPRRLGAVNNITTREKRFGSCRVVRADVVSARSPLYHDPEKLSRALIKLYRHR